MANETLSPNMSLPVPGVSLTSGPTWATDLNNCLSIIDSHTHTSGSGVPITPDAININSNLSFAGNSAINLKSSVYSSQVSPLTTLQATYVSGVDLYYTDGAGNQVRITQAGGVAGSPGSISNLTSPASAAYSSAQTKFIWQSGSNIAADMDFGAIISRNISPNSTFAVTISPPASLGSNYSLVWPTLPASQKFMTLDASGNMSAPWAVDSSTLEISSGTTLQIKAGGVGTTQLADGGVTPVKKAALGQQVSSSCGSFSTGSTSFVAVTNLSVTITTTGRPVWIGLIAVNSTSPTPCMGAQKNGNVSGIEADFVILRDGSGIGVNAVAQNFPLASGIHTLSVPVASLQTVDVVGAGTYVYSVSAKCLGSSTDSAFVTEAKLVAYEL